MRNHIIVYIILILTLTSIYKQNDKQDGNLPIDLFTEEMEQIYQFVCFKEFPEKTSQQKQNEIKFRFPYVHQENNPGEYKKMDFDKNQFCGTPIVLNDIYYKLVDIQNKINDHSFKHPEDKEKLKEYYKEQEKQTGRMMEQLKLVYQVFSKVNFTKKNIFYQIVQSGKLQYQGIGGFGVVFSIETIDKENQKQGYSIKLAFPHSTNLNDSYDFLLNYWKKNNGFILPLSKTVEEQFKQEVGALDKVDKIIQKYDRTIKNYAKIQSAGCFHFLCILSTNLFYKALDNSEAQSVFYSSFTVEERIKKYLDIARFYDILSLAGMHLTDIKTSKIMMEKEITPHDRYNTLAAIDFAGYITQEERNAIFTTQYMSPNSYQEYKLNANKQRDTFNFREDDELYSLVYSIMEIELGKFEFSVTKEGNPKSVEQFQKLLETELLKELLMKMQNKMGIKEIQQEGSEEQPKYQIKLQGSNQLIQSKEYITQLVTNKNGKDKKENKQQIKQIMLYNLLLNYFFSTSKLPNQSPKASQEEDDPFLSFDTFAILLYKLRYMNFSDNAQYQELLIKKLSILFDQLLQQKGKYIIMKEGQIYENSQQIEFIVFANQYSEKFLKILESTDKTNQPFKDLDDLQKKFQSLDGDEYVDQFYKQFYDFNYSPKIVVRQKRLLKQKESRLNILI